MKDPKIILERIAAFKARPAVTRAVLAEILGFSWRHVANKSHLFECVVSSSGDILIYLDSVEKFYQQRFLSKCGSETRRLRKQAGPGSTLAADESMALRRAAVARRWSRVVSKS